MVRTKIKKTNKKSGFGIISCCLFLEWFGTSVDLLATFYCLFVVLVFLFVIFCLFCIVFRFLVSVLIELFFMPRFVYFYNCIRKKRNETNTNGNNTQLNIYTQKTKEKKSPAFMRWFACVKCNIIR